jgi:DNA-binding NtrC family response regulator
VRELKNLIERLMIMTQSDVITRKDIPAPFNQSAKSLRLGMESGFSSESLKEAKGEFEKAFIEENSTNTTETSPKPPKPSVSSAATSTKR